MATPLPAQENVTPGYFRLASFTMAPFSGSGVHYILHTILNVCKRGVCEI
jgi:hypothetical protein